ncbi:MAG: hypothetical protein MZW92_20255 [Comamonadaceae bacterium]|nr:hypothetical protein [Comamonadaceae bacterium]
MIVAAVQSPVASSPFRAVVHRGRPGEAIRRCRSESGRRVRSHAAGRRRDPPERPCDTPRPCRADSRRGERRGCPDEGRASVRPRRRGVTRARRVSASCRGCWCSRASGSRRWAWRSPPRAGWRLLRVGLAISAIAVAIRIAANSGGYGVALAAADPLVAGAIEGLWEAFLGGLASCQRSCLPASARHRGGRRRVEARARAAAVDEPEPRGDGSRKQGRDSAGLLLRGLILMTAGLFAVISGPRSPSTSSRSRRAPACSSSASASSSGSACGPPPTRASPAGSSVGRAGTPWARLASLSRGRLPLLIGAGAVFLGAMAATPPKPPARRSTPGNGRAALCDRRLNEVVFGARPHRDVGRGLEPGWMFPNHEKGMPAQLQDRGVRALLFDAHYGTARRGPREDASRTTSPRRGRSTRRRSARRRSTRRCASATASSVMRTARAASTYVRTWLLRAGSRAARACAPADRAISSSCNPNEVLVIVIEDDVPLPQDVEGRVPRGPLRLDFVYRGAIGAPAPTLREMIASDQRVVVFRGVQQRGRLRLAHRAYAFHAGDAAQFKERPPSSRAGRTGARGDGAIFLVRPPDRVGAGAEADERRARVNAFDTLLARARACQQEPGVCRRTSWRWTSTAAATCWRSSIRPTDSELIGDLRPGLEAHPRGRGRRR